MANGNDDPFGRKAQKTMINEVLSRLPEHKRASASKKINRLLALEIEMYDILQAKGAVPPSLIKKSAYVAEKLVNQIGLDEAEKLFPVDEQYPEGTKVEFIAEIPINQVWDSILPHELLLPMILSSFPPEIVPGVQTILSEIGPLEQQWKTTRLEHFEKLILKEL